MITDTPTLRPIGGTFAAEALGIEVAQPLDGGTLAWIEQAFADHPVLDEPGGLGDAGRRRAHTEFSVERMARRTLQVYTKAR